MTTYHISVAGKNEDGTEGLLANADGDIDIIAYVNRKLDLNAESEYAVTITETSGIGEDPKRTVLALTADGDTVSTLIGSKVRKERKAGKSVDEDNASENDGGADEDGSFPLPGEAQPELASV